MHRDKKYYHALIQSLVPTRVLLKMQDVYVPVALTCREHTDVRQEEVTFALLVQAGAKRLV